MRWIRHAYACSVKPALGFETELESQFVYSISDWPASCDLHTEQESLYFTYLQLIHS